MKCTGGSVIGRKPRFISQLAGAAAVVTSLVHIYSISVQDRIHEKKIKDSF